MPYDKIPGISAVLTDGGLSVNTATNQPRIIVLGSAESGDTHRMFAVTNISEAENEFGKTSELLKKIHEVFAEGANNIALMRIGGTQGGITITDPADGGTISISPRLRDDESLERYSLVIELNDDGELRLLLWDVDSEDWAYDSDEILNVDNSDFEVEAAGAAWNTASLIGLQSSPRDTAITPTLLTVSGGIGGATDYTDATSGIVVAALSSTQVLGTDGTNMSYVERYAAIEEAYQLLDYRDGDMIIPCGVYVNARNIAERDDGSHHEAGTGSAVYTPDYSSGVPSAGDVNNDVLGWLWQYMYRGKVFTYFTDNDLIFDTAATLALSDGGTESLLVTADALGPAGESISIELVIVGVGPGTVTVVGNAISVEVLSTDTGAVIEGYINGDVAASALVTASAGTAIGGAWVASGPTPLNIAGMNYLDHNALTGDSVPAAVVSKFEAGNSDHLRECNFAHQLASFCYRSSTAWKTMLGFVSMAPPPSFGTFNGTRVSRLVVRSWAGNLPDYVSFGSKEGVDSASDNGSGVLGNKFLAGASGYRYAGLDGYGDSSDGLAYGGWVMTLGASLPNEGKWVYGISTEDELTDSGGFPVDIGRQIFISYDYPVHNNDFNSGTSYRGTMEASVAGKLVTIEENLEPIGPINGQMQSLSQPLEMTASLTNEFAEVRAIGLMRDERTGTARNIIVTCRTAAHPDSDYTRVSTIRCVNREIQGIRNIAMPYIGKSFSSTTLEQTESWVGLQSP
jgi:hypothetical protein